MSDQISFNLWRSRILIALFILISCYLGFIFGRIIGFGWFGLILAFTIAAVASWFSLYYSADLALAVSQARPLPKEENPYLCDITESLALTAGIPTPKVYLIADNAPNAFATGRDPEHAVIAVTTGLMAKLNRPELEGVIAHEICHIKNYDTRLNAVVMVLIGMIVLLSDWMASNLWYNRGINCSRSTGKTQRGFILIGLVLAIFAPLIAQILRLTISRKREFLADTGGALLTHYPEGLANALEKLASDKAPLAAANKATAHLYIINPLEGYQGFLNRLFSTHPPVARRIIALKAM